MSNPDQPHSLVRMLQQASRRPLPEERFTPREAIESPKLYRDHSKDAIAKAIKDASQASADDIEKMAVQAIADGERRAAELRKVKQFILDKGEFMANSAVDFVDFIGRMQAKPVTIEDPP